ncbi:hypothetical protein HKCCSP123_13900 [Rhodobacterales bacterium HKCCSP123]|nr:hypothetical protein [Rhodobacterales bacterium HKCCSP123]
MPASWRSFGDIADSVSHQDPLQHWLLVPSPAESDARKKQQADLTVAYVFNFADEASLRRFRAQFDPTEGAPGGAQVFFPKGIDAQTILGDPTLMTVGFSRLGNFDLIFEYIQERELGEVFLTGIEVENVRNLSAPLPELDPVDQNRFVAVIDTDIAFANARFRRDATRTRFAAFWDQNGEAGNQLGLFLGRALYTNDIDALLARFNQNGNVDEAALYNQYYADAYSQESFPRLPVSLGHGTHVLDVVTGGEPDGPPILGVNLRSRAVDATHGMLLFPWLILALLWILKLSATTRGTPKAHVNFSFGGIAGRHDGKSLIERVFDALVTSDLVSAVSLPAGNFYDSQTHASLSGEDLAKPGVLKWVVQPDDGSSNIVEIWLPPDAPDKSLVEVQITPPSGPARRFSDIDFGIWELSDGAEVQARVYVQRVTTFGLEARTRITIIGRHTAIDRDYFQHHGGLASLAGDWTIEVFRTGLEAERSVEFWIERDDQLGLARNGARQSYFQTYRAVWPEPLPEDLPVTNENTLSDIATGSASLVFSGAFRKDLQVPGYSSEGRAEPKLLVPTAAAICEDSRVHRGVLASGYFSGSTRAMNGTSVASAVGARIVNNRLAFGQGVLRDDIWNLAGMDNGGTPPDSAPIDPVFETYTTVPKTRIGGGILQTAWTRMPRFHK